MDLECGEALAPDEEYAQLQQEAAIIAAIEGVTDSGESSYDGPELNRLDFHARVRPPGEIKPKMIRRSGSQVFDSKLKCAREVKRKIGLLVGEETVRRAEEQVVSGAGVMPPAASSASTLQPVTAAELEWLASWIDAQERPDEITSAQADSALAAQRAKLSGAATLERLQQTQWLQARLRAAELRAAKAQSVVARIESELEEAQAAQSAKAARTGEPSSERAVPLHNRAATAEENPPNWDKFHAYSREKYQELEVKEQDRRAVQIDRTIMTVDLPPGDDLRSWFKHWRRGVHGALLSFAQGSLGAIIYMLTFCVRFFQVEKQLGKELGGNWAMTKDEYEKAQLDAFIVDQVRDALHVNKHCHTEAQRREYHIGMGHAVPTRDSGLLNKVAKRLQVHPGTRSKPKDGGFYVTTSDLSSIDPPPFDGSSSFTVQPTGGKLSEIQIVSTVPGWERLVRAAASSSVNSWDVCERGQPFVFDLLVDRRADFNAAAVENARRSLSEGDEVLSHGQRCELTRIVVGAGAEPECGWPCVLTFRVGTAEEEHSYSSMFGKQIGSARLQCIPPSLAPPPRTSANAVSQKTRALVRTHAEEVCPTSPCKRDAMRHHVGPRVWETRQALILLFPIYTLMGLFFAKHPDLLKRSKYLEVLHEEVWHLKHAYRETCLCRTCFNMRCYREALKVIADILRLLVAPPSADSEDAVVGDPEPTTVALLAFCDSCDAGSRRATTEMVCANCLDDVELKCVHQDCSNCSFSRLWSKGARPKLVDAFGKLRPGVSKIWLHSLQWERLKIGASGGSSEDDLRQSCEGTIIEYFDELEPVMKTSVRHGFHIDQSKQADRELHENAVPGMIDEDSDWSENGSLKNKDQLQQEYWVIVHYSLLISIARFLVMSCWTDTTSALPKGTEVTVEPSVRSPITAELVPDACFAVVEIGSTEVGADVEYTVRCSNDEIRKVPRTLLRHRKWHRIAFLQFTNDKKHDHWSSTAFATRRQGFFQVWNDNGRQAAHTFACDDLADAKRKELEAIAAKRCSERASAIAAEPDLTLAAKVAEACRRHIHVVNLPRPRIQKCGPSDQEFTEWYASLDEQKFWSWIEHSDNATHFKSKENLHYWSTRVEKTEFIKMVWVGFGCPGHGKGPWDGIGAMVKTKLSRDLTNEQVLTPSRKMASALEAAQHARAIFCCQEWVREHMHMKIHECVVLYLDESEISRPAVPDDVDTVVGIMSHYSYLFLSSNTYCMRPYICFCPACARVRGRGPELGTRSVGRILEVPDCRRKKLTWWTEGEFKVTPKAGVANRKKRLAELWAELRPSIKPRKFGCCQVRELWSTDEMVHYRPGHFWVFEYGDAGDGSSFEKEFSHLARRSWEEYKGIRFYHGEVAIVVTRWLHRLSGDKSGLDFIDWDSTGKDVDPDAPPAAMIVNSSEVRAVWEVGTDSSANFRLLMPPALEAAARVSGTRRQSARLLEQAASTNTERDAESESTEPRRFTMKARLDNQIRERCTGDSFPRVEIQG